MDFTCVWRGLTSGRALVTWLLLTLVADGQAYTCGQCDCIIRDPGSEDKAIINVKPKCREGQITWLSSYGAIRLEVDPGYSGDYRFCFLVESEGIKTVVSQEELSRTYGNYKLKVLDNVELKLLHLFNAKGRSKEYCISGSGSLRLYLETERDEQDGGAAKVKINYDVEGSSHLLSYNAMEECRPCTDAELLGSYCSSDFVAVGSMDDVTHDVNADISSISVSVKQLLSQRDVIFQLQGHGQSRPHELKGVVHVPLRCGIRHGEGDFLFTGRVRLGVPVLQCAPRYEQWRKLLEDALINGDVECSYNT